MISNYRVLYIATKAAQKKYAPKFKKDSEEFPELIDHVEDEFRLFVIDEDTQEIDELSEFLERNNPKSITVEWYDDNDPLIKDP